MSGSTIVVALNAELLRRLDLRPGEADGGGAVPTDAEPADHLAPA